jgi:hypothetical protein
LGTVKRFPFLSAGKRVSALLQALIPFQPLVDQCWGLLKRTSYLAFPSTSRSNPSEWVRVGRGEGSYPGDFWQGVAVPTLSELIGVSPSYSGGWANPMARALVESYLRKNLKTSPWEVWIDFAR